MDVSLGVGVVRNDAVPCVLGLGEGRAHDLLSCGANALGILVGQTEKQYEGPLRFVNIDETLLPLLGDRVMGIRKGQPRLGLVDDFFDGGFLPPLRSRLL